MLAGEIFLRLDGRLFFHPPKQPILETNENTTGKDRMILHAEALHEFDKLDEKAIDRLRIDLNQDDIEGLKSNQQNDHNGKREQ